MPDKTIKIKVPVERKAPWNEICPRAEVRIVKDSAAMVKLNGNELSIQPTMALVKKKPYSSYNLTYSQQDTHSQKLHKVSRELLVVDPDCSNKDWAAVDPLTDLDKVDDSEVPPDKFKVEVG
jgi:hypothetical protein